MFIKHKKPTLYTFLLNVLTYSKYIHVRLPYTCVYDLSKSMSFSSTILTFLSKEEIKLGGGGPSDENTATEASIRRSFGTKKIG